ncbi:kinase-like protein, partial [Ascoidea rubescens DSM 1968]
MNNLLEKFLPGTQLTVGSHKVVILKYIAEGGFAHIYKLHHPCYNLSNNFEYTDIACLKRVLVKDKAGLNQLRNEVDVMKKLIDSPYIVKYIDSHASKLSSNTSYYQVFVLMEYCSNNSLLDFMNLHIKSKLNEYQITKIFYQICLAISYMHYLSPPLIHRDIKIENVLIDSNFTFKICDFGSTSEIINPPNSQQQFYDLQSIIFNQTTPQYRSPEMINLYSNYPINEKSDIWALGILLYKLCYYITPFENYSNNEMAILQSYYSFPALPVFSKNLKNLIIILLQKDPIKRPNIYQIIHYLSLSQKINCPIVD